MVIKKHRLQKNRHFKFIYNKGKTLVAKDISLVFIKTKYPTFKVGFSVSNKIGKACKRNKIKRRLRESFNQIIGNVKTSNNYIFVARKDSVNSSFLELKNQMIQLLKKSDNYVC